MEQISPLRRICVKRYRIVAFHQHKTSAAVRVVPAPQKFYPWRGDRLAREEALPQLQEYFQLERPR